MTYELKTNHGIIEAGFFSLFVEQVRFGEFQLPTSTFCYSVADLIVQEQPQKVMTSVGERELSWDKEQSLVRFGKYEIPVEDFGTFAGYIYRGGFFGWNGPESTKRPQYVDKSLERIYSSAVEPNILLNSLERILGLNPDA